MVRDMMDGNERDMSGDDVLSSLSSAHLQQHRQQQPAPGLQVSGEPGGASPKNDGGASEAAHGQVVFGRAPTYVGATHLMAMLDDVSLGLPPSDAGDAGIAIRAPHVWRWP